MISDGEAKMRNEALHRICAGFLLAGCWGVVWTAPAGAVFGADATGDPAVENSGSAAAEKNAYRTWTDASGKHQVVARQLAVDDGWVLLETKDGRRIRVPISQFSPADQAIIKGQAADWPQFRGPNRDGKSPETGLLKEWPATGPSLVRTISGVGGGFSSPVIAGQRIYITGKVGDDLKIFCFDGSGRKIWEKTHAPAFREANGDHHGALQFARRCRWVCVRGHQLPYARRLRRGTPTHGDRIGSRACLGKLKAEL